jgi:pyruvate/2-oxoacid:ferredoxin oxidoreductase alpha subunit
MIEVTGDIENTECALVALGTMGEEAEQAVDYLSEKNIKAVVLRPRVFRPFPKKELISLIKKVPRILVIDRAVSFGNAGQLAIEIQAELYANKVEVKFHQKIMGLGGMDVTYVDIATEVERVLKEE